MQAGDGPAPRGSSSPRRRWPASACSPARPHRRPRPSRASASSSTPGCWAGDVSTGCAKGDPDSGLEALTKAGYSYAFVPRQPGQVCQIDGAPECSRTSTDTYWSYWWRAKGSSRWVYATEGAATHDPAPGATEAWVWQDGGRREPPDIALSTDLPPGRRPADQEPRPAPDRTTGRASPSPKQSLVAEGCRCGASGRTSSSRRPRSPPRPRRRPPPRPPRPRPAAPRRPATVDGHAVRPPWRPSGAGRRRRDPALGRRGGRRRPDRGVRRGCAGPLAARRRTVTTTAPAA